MRMEDNRKICRGVDVSGYQGNVDWQRAKAAGVQFAILKVIRKNLAEDRQFENNWRGCLAAGIPVQGVYNYSYATTPSKAVADAQAVLRILGQDRHPFVWLDWEDACLPKGREAADIINAYGGVVTAGGCRFGIYSGMSYYNSYLAGIVGLIRPHYRKAWTARYYNGKKEMPIAACVNAGKRPHNTMTDNYGWQYTSKGLVDGISGYVDLNEWYVDVEAAGDMADAAAQEQTDYRLCDFIRDSRIVWDVTPITGAEEIVRRTVTIGTAINASHPAVTPLERYMKALGYYTGSVEADRGRRPVFGNGMKKAVILYQTHVVKAQACHRDGVLTAGGATWRKLYGADSGYSI